MSEAGDDRPFVIVIPIYEGVDLVDVAAPYEIFNWMAESWKERKVEVWLAAEQTERPIRTRDRFPMTAHKTFGEIERADLLWTPGAGPDYLARQMGNHDFLDFLRRLAEGAEWVTSVCEGAFLLAAAGLLDGYEATTHWAFLPCFERYPNIRVAPGNPRWVQSGNRVTGGGISSGFDEALRLVILIAGEDVAKAVQLTTQYFPQPPVTGEIQAATSCPIPQTRYS